MPDSAEIERLKRLVEIQTQIVDLAKRNELAKQDCDALWQELACDARRSRRSFLRAPAVRGRESRRSLPGVCRRLAGRIVSALVSFGSWLLPAKLGS